MSLKSKLPGRRKEAQKRLSTVTKMANLGLVAKVVSDLSSRSRKRKGPRIGKRTLGLAGIAGAGAGALAFMKSRKSGGASEGEPQVHTEPAPREGHPAGTGERSDRDVGGPATGAESVEDAGATGGATGTEAPTPLEPHE